MAMVNATLNGLFKLRTAEQIHQMRARTTN
jgi:hypothetical protein